MTHGNPLSSFIFDIILEVLAISIMKMIKNYKDYKENARTNSLHISVCKWSKQIIHKLLGLINEFSNIPGYMFNKVSIVFLGHRNEYAHASTQLGIASIISNT